MNIHELDSYDLGNAVKFNDKLNPRIWGADEKMRPEVRDQLRKIADDFREFLGIDVEVKDITVSGSNAAYTYTPHSDIDLHLVVDLPEADRSEVYRELFDAKKYAYNDQHNIKIGDYDVELYVQDANKKHHSQGIYSLMNNDWVSVPKRRRPDVDDISVKSKFEDLGHRIEDAIKSGDYEKISAMANKIKTYRQAGLDAHGEFGPENLAFKILRTQGLIKKLYDARNQAKDQLLSLDERRKKKKRKSVKYGYGAYWYPGTAYAGQDHPAGTEGGDGGGDGGESIREDSGTTDEQILKDFIDFCFKELKIEQMPRVKLRRDPQWPAVHKTFGRYNDENKTLEVAWGQRHIMDVLRTVAHELTHKHQHEREGESMGPDAGETGSPYENEANARAGVLMRDYGRLHPEYFTVGQAHDLEESASGYIPTRAQAKDPRFSMALTVDIKPGQVGKEANKLKLKTDRQGHPQIANPNGLFENLMLEYKKFDEKKLFALAAEDYSPDEPPGPEFRPTMPAGTLRVDVSDVYDWYKLGQHISNMKGLGQHDFGKGPPSSIISFGDEDTEHKFIRDLEATGLDVTDIDPKDPQKRPGTKIKTDPTYNVDEVIHTPVAKGKDAEQYYKFILGKARMGRPLTRAEQDYVKMYQMYRQQKLAEVSDERLQTYLYQAGQQVDRRQERMAQARERLNKGYEIYHAEDPTRTVHRFEADTPEQARRYYEKYNANYESDLDYDLKLRRSTGLMESEEDLDESTLPSHVSIQKGETWESYPGSFWVVAIDNDRDRKVGQLLVYPRDGQWIGEYMVVGQEYRRQGVGTAMWNFAEKTVGGPVITVNVTADGKKFQRARRRAVAEGKFDANPATYSLPRRPLNVPELIRRGAIFITHPHGPQGWETDRPTWDFSLITLQNVLEKSPPWSVEYKKHLRPESYREAIGSRQFWVGLGDGKYNQILWSIKKLGIPDEVAFLDSKKPVKEDEDLDEVKMSPGALEKFATSPEAKGIRAGFEAELIFRDTQGESDEMDPEPNYDADERAYSIQQVIEFFDNDDYGYGLSDRQRNRLEEALDETYMQWRDEQIVSDFRNEAEDLIRERLLEETPMSERIHFYLTDSLQMSDEQADAVVKAGADAPRFTNSEAQKEYTDKNPEYQAYLDAADAAEQELDESVEDSVNREDGYWDEALDDFRDNWSGDDDSFFSDVGLRWMSDIANEYNLDWPVWDGGGQQNYGSRSWETIGALLQDAVDMPVVVSSDYHSTRRRPGQWIIEPDGSLDPDDKNEEAGLEIVSPPMPLLTAIEKLRQVTDWANNPKLGNAYTNSSTGLHMGVSLPTMKSEGAEDDTGIDYVKLILFMGDKYVQQQFGREANTYCASALDKLKQNIKGKRSDPAGVVKLLQHGLTELAYRELQKGVGTSKYTSAHIQPGYIEFRSPGGDWLAKADEEIGVLENTMLRFARAMAIAGDPSADRQEYAKKLYKLVTQDNPEYADQLKLFSEFSAGTINKEQLKKQWADTVLQKELPSVGKEEYEVFRRDNKDSPDATVGTLYARDYDDAYDQFLRQYGRDINNLDVRVKQPWFDVFDDTGKIVKTIRAKDADTATDRAQYEFGERWTDAWKIYRRPDDTPEPKASPRAQVAKRIAQPKSKAVGDDDASDWEAVYKPTGRVFDTLAHADTSQALAWRDMVMRSHGFTNVSDILVRRAGHQQAADARRDSVDLQRSLGVQDVDIDVTQNFAPDLSAYERNSERIDAIRAQAQQPRQNYELVQHDDTDRVIHRMPNATADEVRAWIDQQEREGMPAGFLRTRIVAESTGQHDDEQTRTALDMAAQDYQYQNWADVEMRGTEQAKTAIRRHAVTKLNLAQHKDFNMLGKSRSAISKGVDQVDREFIDKQIQTARKLGDDVNENFADKKVKGKSRPGRVKRAGASCAGSVTDLRAKAKKYSGEKGKMYHWCANMKSGRKK